jgi:hypothetical protein
MPLWWLHFSRWRIHRAAIEKKEAGQKASRQAISPMVPCVPFSNISRQRNARAMALTVALFHVPLWVTWE